MFGRPRASGGTPPGGRLGFSASSGALTRGDLGDETCRVAEKGNNNGLSTSKARKAAAAAAVEATTLRVNLSSCKYDSIRTVMRECGFHEVDEEFENWDLHWTDLSVTEHRVSRMFPFQFVNHFPGMLEICRKASLSRALKRMQKTCRPGTYDFAPTTWEHPSELESFKTHCRENPGGCYIVKPTAGAMGRGIYLITTPSQLDSNRHDAPSAQPFVIQKYISNPFLLGGFKFDLRVYALVTSVAPLVVYVYEEGIARFATVAYEPPCNKNLGEKTMHLTNYSLNKHAQGFDTDDREDAGTKRTLTSLWQALTKHGHDTDATWEKIRELVVKTIIPISPQLAHNYHAAVTSGSTSGDTTRRGGDSKSAGNDGRAPGPNGRSQRQHGRNGSYASQFAVSSTMAGSYAGLAGDDFFDGIDSARTSDAPRSTHEITEPGSKAPHADDRDHTSRCFEVLGFDVLLDDTMKPTLIEVNHSPSFGTDSALDKKIKEGLLRDTIDALRIDPGNRVDWLAKEKVKQKTRLYDQSGGNKAMLGNGARGGKSGASKSNHGTYSSDSRESRPSGAEPGPRAERVISSDAEQIASLRQQLAAFGAGSDSDDESGETSPRKLAPTKINKEGGANKFAPPEHLGLFRRAHPPIRDARKTQEMASLLNTASTHFTPVYGCACVSCDSKNVQAEVSYATSHARKVRVAFPKSRHCFTEAGDCLSILD